MKSFISAIFKTLVLSLAIIAQVNFAYAQSQGAIIPNGKTTFLDANGNPLSAGKVFYYIPSTTTPKTTYQDINQTIPNTNPVILDAAGRSPAQIWGAGNYRQIVQDQNSNVIWDVTTSTNGTGNAVASTGDGDLVGTIKPWAGMTAPSQYLFAFGQQLSRTTFAPLFIAITSTQAASCTSGNNVVNGLSDTTNFWIGMTVEIACVSGGVTTITAKTSTSVTLTATPNATQTVNATFFPWGNGNGTTTFTLPDLRGLVPTGNNNMGGVASSNLTTQFFGSTNPNSIGALGGNQSTSVTLLIGNLPSINSTGAGLAFTSSNSMHVPNAANVNTTFNPNAGGGGAFAVPTATGGYSDLTQVSGTTAGQSVNSNGTNSTPFTFSVVQPSKTVNYIIKVIPDANSTTATGVTDINGMTGSISCGTLLLCTGNVISVNLPTFTANAVLKGNGTSTPVNSSITDNGSIIATNEPIDITNTSLNALQIQNAASNGDVWTCGANTVGGNGSCQFAPHTAQTSFSFTNSAGPLIFAAADCTVNPSNCFSPSIYLNTLEGTGTTPIGLPGGANAYGVTITGTGQPTQGSGNVAQMNFINTSPGPYASNSDSGAFIANWYCWHAGDCGIQMWGGGSNAAGTFANPAANAAGDAFGKVSFFGRNNAAGGTWNGNESVRIDARATEAQTSTANGGGLFIDTTTTGALTELNRIGITENLLISSSANQWTKGANGVNSANGAILVKNGTMPSPLLSGANAASMGAVNGGMQISGTVSNDNTCTGCIGESPVTVLASGSAVSFVNITAKNITSISLTAGDWDVYGECWINSSAASTQQFCNVTTSSNTLGAGPADNQAFSASVATTTGTNILSTGRARISINSTTSVFMVGFCAFASGTCTGFGKISARRMH